MLEFWDEEEGRPETVNLDLPKGVLPCGVASYSELANTLGASNESGDMINTVVLNDRGERGAFYIVEYKNSDLKANAFDEISALDIKASEAKETIKRLTDTSTNPSEDGLTQKLHKLFLLLTRGKS